MHIHPFDITRSKLKRVQLSKNPFSLLGAPHLVQTIASCPWPCPCPVIFECALFFLPVRRAHSQVLLDKDSVALSNLDPRDHSSQVIKINCKVRSQMSSALSVDTH